MGWIDTDSGWFYGLRLGIKVSIVVGLFFVGYHFYERNRLANMSIRSEPETIELPADAYVFVPKSYVTDLAGARRKLIGTPLWVKEGYRWSYDPGDRLFEPLERIVPKSVTTNGNEVRLVFDKDGREASFAIGSPERVFVDDIFFIKDPHEIYDHWTDEMWRKAANGDVEVGMSEIQVVFALGVGEVVRQSPGAATRIVDYKQCAEGGHDPVRVTFSHHVVQSIEALAP